MSEYSSLRYAVRRHEARGIECITIVSEFNYNMGSAITYLWRAGRKPGSSTIEDLEKAIFHLKNEIERLQKECEHEEAECCQDSS